MLRSSKKNFTPAEYLAMEGVAEYKSEYYNGEIFALAGGSSDHSLISVNITSGLNQQLAKKPCRLYNSDMRLFVERSGLYTYPDAMVVCGKIEFVPERDDTLTNPILIVEVLSESTRDYDRGRKFNFYKQIPALQEFVAIESERAHVERYRRGGDEWAVEIFEGLDASARFDSIECEISLRDMYAKVSWL